MVTATAEPKTRRPKYATERRIEVKGNLPNAPKHQPCPQCRRPMERTQIHVRSVDFYCRPCRRPEIISLVRRRNAATREVPRRQKLDPQRKANHWLRKVR